MAVTRVTQRTALELTLPTFISCPLVPIGNVWSRGSWGMRKYKL